VQVVEVNTNYFGLGTITKKCDFHHELRSSGGWGAYSLPSCSHPLNGLTLISRSL
jgi:hypothetical protein